MDNLKNFIISKVSETKLINQPFKFFEIDNLIPEAEYYEFINNLPKTENYKPLMHKHTLIDNKPTRFELSLAYDDTNFQKHVLKMFNNCSIALKVLDTFNSTEFKNSLLKKFNVDFGIIPYPHLYRDLAGFDLPPHTDIAEKAITFGWYLPIDESYIDSGLGLFIKENNSFSRFRTIQYKPNKAFAFLRSENSWHGANHKIDHSCERNSLFITFYRENILKDGKLIINDPNVERKEFNIYR